MDHAAAATAIQARYRTVLAQRAFSERLYAAFAADGAPPKLEALEAELMRPRSRRPSHSSASEDDTASPRRAPATPAERRGSGRPTLEEAQAEAFEIQNLRSDFLASAGAPAAAPPPPPPLLARATTVAGSGSTGSGPSSPLAPASELSRRCSCGSASKRSSAPASPARGGSVGAVTAASPSDADALEFTEAMAGEMTLDALKELSQVLQRLIHERNSALIDLLQHRDELLHERAYRQSLVEQLLQQVDRSRGLRGSRVSTRRR